MRIAWVAQYAAALLPKGKNAKKNGTPKSAVFSVKPQA